MLKTKDPLERLKLLVSGIIGSVGYNIKEAYSKGPIQPRLGETL